MLTLHEWAEIRGLYRVEGMSIRGISRRLRGGAKDGDASSSGEQAAGAPAQAALFETRPIQGAD
jgi:hypothetical protein